MQDCLQVVSLPRILAVKQLQELDGRKEHGQENQNQNERWQQGYTERIAERKWQNKDDKKKLMLLTFDLQTDSPVGQTSGLCTFWQCWAGIPDSPRTGWRTRIPTGERRKGEGRKGRNRGRKDEKESVDVKKIKKLKQICHKWNS